MRTVQSCTRIAEHPAKRRNSFFFFASGTQLTGVTQANRLTRAPDAELAGLITKAYANGSSTDSTTTRLGADGFAETAERRN